MTTARQWSGLQGAISRVSVGARVILAGLILFSTLLLAGVYLFGWQAAAPRW